MIATKNHTWEDFVACGQWLVDNKYTSKAHWPAKARARAGFRSAARSRRGPTCSPQPWTSSASATRCVTEFSPNGPPNVPEFGSVTTEAGFRALYAMDAYQHVVDGTAYPAVMLITGFNDPRVASWELAKFDGAPAASVDQRPADSAARRLRRRPRVSRLVATADRAVAHRRVRVSALAVRRPGLRRHSEVRRAEAVDLRTVLQLRRFAPSFRTTRSWRCAQSFNFARFARFVQDDKTFALRSR